MEKTGELVTNSVVTHPISQHGEHDSDSRFRPVVSVIVPVLNEHGVETALARHLHDVCSNMLFELILVRGCTEPYDGIGHSCHSRVCRQADRSESSSAPCTGIQTAAEDQGAQGRQSCLPYLVCSKVISAPKGRSVQMNAGAAVAQGQFLLFLHADTLLPQQAFRHMAEALGRVQAGAFGLCIEDKDQYFRLVERVADVRNRLTRTPYGDQAQFFRAGYFRTLQGYADIPIMEDVDIMRRIRRRGDAIEILKYCVATSARRWHKEGRLYCSVRNVCLRTLYALGVSPHSLSRWYRAHRG